MENEIFVSDQREEVRKLEEKVRSLELQLSQQTSPNAKSGINCASSDIHQAAFEGDCEIVDLSDVDFSSCTCWWYDPDSTAAHSEPDENHDRSPTGDRVLAQLRHDGSAQRQLYNEISNAEQDRRKNIDTRTFTRPKKRGRLSLEMSEMMPTDVPLAMYYEDSELVNMTCSMMSSSLIASQTFSGSVKDLRVSRISNNNFQKMASQPELREQTLTTSLVGSGIFDSSTFNLMDSSFLDPKATRNVSNRRNNVPVNTTFTPSPLASNSSFNKGSDPGLNYTFRKNESRTLDTTRPVNTNFSPTSNGAFIAGGIQRTSLSVARPGSTDSCGADDDQLSSTSDSSHTSATRLMSVGDVQNIARIQEESLVASTPRQSHLIRGLIVEDTISPILAQEIENFRSDGHTGGYGSDQSSRSPLSSLHSSPTGSPFGSNTALSGPVHTYNDMTITRPGSGVLQRRLQPIQNKGSTIRHPRSSYAPSRPTNVPSSEQAPRPGPRSGLRPPMVRPRYANLGSGLPRPASTGIPRPASRIPPPKIRMTRPSQQTNGQNWADECY